MGDGPTLRSLRMGDGWSELFSIGDLTLLDILNDIGGNSEKQKTKPVKVTKEHRSR